METEVKGAPPSPRLFLPALSTLGQVRLHCLWAGHKTCGQIWSLPFLTGTFGSCFSRGTKCPYWGRGREGPSVEGSVSPSFGNQSQRDLCNSSLIHCAHPRVKTCRISGGGGVSVCALRCIQLVGVCLHDHICQAVSCLAIKVSGYVSVSRTR